MSTVSAGPGRRERFPMTRRRTLAAPAVAGAILAGCAGPGAPATPPAADGAGAPARVVWLNWEGSGASLEGNTQSIASFQQKHPRITIDNAALTSSGATYWDKYAALKASGSPLDIWEWEPANVVDSVLRKQVLDLQPLATREQFDLTDFFPKGVDQYRYRNGLWGLPRDFPNRELAYSVTAFEKEGLRSPAADWKSPDWTWDVFLDAARRLTRPDGSQWGLNTGRGLRMWAVWVWSNGGEVIDEQRLVCTLDQPPAVEALQFMQDLIHRHRVWPESLPAGRQLPGRAGGHAGDGAGRHGQLPARHRGQVRLGRGHAPPRAKAERTSRPGVAPGGRSTPRRRRPRPPGPSSSTSRARRSRSGSAGSAGRSARAAR